MFRNRALCYVSVSMFLLSGCQTYQQDATPKHRGHNTTATIQTTTQPTTQTKTSPVKQSQQPIAAPTNREPSPVVKPHTITIQEKTIQIPSYSQHKLVLGLTETAALPNQNLTLQAKLDTGASGSSIDARDMELFERDGKKWVKFNVYRTTRGVVPMEMPMKGTIKVKRPGLKAIERPLVRMTVRIGDITQSLLVSLVDRSQYQSPLLIGRDFMQDIAIIDVAQQQIATRKVLSTRLLHATGPLPDHADYREILQPVHVEGLKTLGAVEYAQVQGINTPLQARIDTGAHTSSIDARNIDIIKKNEYALVRFETPDANGKSILMERPLVRFVRIKRHGESHDRRPVITLPVQIGDIYTDTEFTLRNREDYTFPLLIGASFLSGQALVDVAHDHLTEQQELKGK